MHEEELLRLPIRREVEFQYKGETRVGSVAILNVSKHEELVKCVISIQLDICRETSVYGVDTIQALQAGIATIKAHMERVGIGT